MSCIIKNRRPLGRRFFSTSDRNFFKKDWKNGQKEEKHVGKTDKISTLTDVPLEKGRTLIFFDEVQACKEMVTAIKFLVEEGSFRYILSGSLLGVELNYTD